MTVENNSLHTFRQMTEEAPEGDYLEMKWRNFEGRETMFKPAGTRTFNMVLPEQRAAAMLADGWNIKTKEPREGTDDDPLYTLEVAVGYKFKPPRVVLITSTGRVNLGEESVEVVDFADIMKADVVIRARHWEVGGKTGVKAYLKSAFITIDEDELEREYGINDVKTASLEDVRALAGDQDMGADPF